MASSSGNGGVLPVVHTSTSSSKPPPPPPPRTSSSTRRCVCICLLVTLAVLLVLTITLVILFLTVLRVRDPTTRVLSTSLAGVAPRVTLPNLNLQLNITLLITAAVHNPNPASFAYPSGGTAVLTYRGAQVGDARIEPGRVPSRGDGQVRLALTVQADRLAADIGKLLADVEAGAVPVETSTVIPGRVAIFGVFKRHAVAYSDCRIVVGVREMAVRSQECTDRTKL